MAQTRYLTVQQFIDSFSEDELNRIADRTRDDVYLADSGPVGMAIDGASSEAESILKAQYQVPFISPFPPELVRVVADLTRGRLWIDEQILEVSQRVEDARFALAQIAAGERALIGADGIELPSSNRPKFIQDARVFGRSNMGGF